MVDQAKLEVAQADHLPRGHFQRLVGVLNPCV